MSPKSILGLIIMIFVAGLLGGGVNCLQARKADDPAPKSQFYYILLSVVAAFCVPLFLSLTRSALLSDALSDQKTTVESWFILFAVCLIAAVFAQNFLESVSSQLLKRMDTVESKTAEAGEIARKAATDSATALNTAEAHGDAAANQAPDTARKSLVDTARLRLAGLTADNPEERKVLDALRNPHYPLGRRSAGGIVIETKLTRAIVLDILNRLIGNDVAEKVAEEESGADYYQLRA